MTIEDLINSENSNTFAYKFQIFKQKGYKILFYKKRPKKAQKPKR